MLNNPFVPFQTLVILFAIRSYQNEQTGTNANPAFLKLELLGPLDIRRLTLSIERYRDKQLTKLREAFGAKSSPKKNLQGLPRTDFKKIKHKNIIKSY